MKKWILVLVLVSGVASLQAQDLRAGLKVGINNAGIISSVESPHFKIGNRIGGFLEIGIADNFFLQPELLYSSKGFEWGDTEVSDNYLSIPIMAKYAFVNNDKLQVFGQAGPYIGYLMYSREQGSINNFNQLTYEVLDIGTQFGIGAAYQLGCGSVTLDARLGFSIEGINRAIGSYLNNLVSPSVTVGYAFEL
jgi:hypothetical protein